MLCYKVNKYRNFAGDITMNSIRAKIMWLLSGSALISSLIIGLLGLLLTSAVINKNSTENMNLLCRTHADNIDFSLAKIEDSVDTLVHFISSDLANAESLGNETFRSGFSDVVGKNALHHIESVEGASAIYLHYDPSFIGKNDGFFYIKDKDGAFQSQPLTKLSAFLITNNNHLDYWRIPTAKGKATWLEAYYNTSLQQHVISYIVPVYIKDQLVGVIGADISADYISQLVKEVSIFNSGQAAILNSSGRVLYHPNFQRGVLIGEGDPGFHGVIDQLTKEDTTSELISYKLKNVGKKLASCKLRNGMLMICFAPVSEIYHQQNMLILTNIAITALVVLISLLVAALASKKFAQPIQRLREAAKHLIDGNFDYNIQSYSHDEIGELTATFLETRKTLQHQILLLDAEAHKDGLTGVGNKSAFSDKEIQINQEISAGTANFSVAIFDVNRLKVTNDVLGHLAGDRLLMTVANHLASTFGSQNVYRLGGDEFAVFLPAALTFESYETIVNCIADMKDLSVEGYPHCKVSCAYGFTRFDRTTDKQLSDVLNRADIEMYKNKALTKKEIAPWPEGTKGLKQLQVDKYCQLLQSLKDSTDDYLFLINLESRYIYFFGEVDKQFSFTDGLELSHGISDMLGFIHSNDHDLVKYALTAVLNRETETLDINFRIQNNNHMRWVNCRGSIIQEETYSHFVLIGRLSQNAVQHLYNPVTTLFNKSKLMKELRNAHTNDFSYLVLLDIDNLSDINLKHGAVYGDQLLKSLAEELENQFSMWQIYHTEKDRFVILLDANTKKNPEQVYEQLNSAMAGKCTISAAAVPNDKSLFISAENIYDYAVQTMINAKREHKGQLTFFSQQNVLEKIATVELWEELTQCINSGFDGFSLVYQPQIRDSDYTIISAEALLRFHSKTRGNIYPDQFIPILEQTGLIHRIGLWVIDQALEKCKQWRNTLPELKVSVNLSPKQLEIKSVTAQIKDLLTKHNLPGDALILEITESSQLDGNEEVYTLLANLKQAGMQIAIDDFGTGYSNLGNLKHIHANILKVDRVFVQDITENGYNYHLIRNVIEFAKSNNLKVCLEGVETRKELLVLSGLHPDSYQGYLFDKPLSPSDLEDIYLNPASAQYQHRHAFIQELSILKNEVGISHFDPKDILRVNEVGLWIIRIGMQENQCELYTDATMDKLLAVDHTVTPKECYEHWHSRIHPNYLNYVHTNVNKMIKTDKAIQLEYPWLHPIFGDVMVRCSGRRAKNSDGTVILEGYHRIITDVEGI